MSTFHERLRPRGRRLSSDILEAIEHGEVLGNGLFARVVALQEHTVLKLTTCEASVRLLRQLHARTRQNCAVAGLPLVFADLGIVADGACGPYRGFVVERLFESTQSTNAQAARVVLWPLYRRHRGIKERPIVQRANYRKLHRLVADIQARYERLAASGLSRRATGVELAAELASMTDNGLMEAFEFLEEFIARGNYDLDILNPGNLLFNAFGAPMLADPVAPLFEEQDLQPAPTKTRFAVMGLVPVQQHGLTVSCRWDTLAIADCASSATAEARAHRRGLVEVEVLPYRSRRHLQRLRQRHVDVPVYQTPFWRGVRRTHTT